MTMCVVSSKTLKRNKRNKNFGRFVRISQSTLKSTDLNRCTILKKLASQKARPVNKIPTEVW